MQIIASRDACSGVQEYFYRSFMAKIACQMQGCLITVRRVGLMKCRFASSCERAAPVVRSIDGSTTCKQNLDDVASSSFDCAVKRCISAAILSLMLSQCLAQNF